MEHYLDKHEFSVDEWDLGHVRDGLHIDKFVQLLDELWDFCVISRHNQSDP